MDTISELNSHPFRAYFHRDGKSEGIIPAITAQDHFQYSLKLLEIESMGDREIAAACPSGVQAMIAARILSKEGTGKTKIPNDRKLHWQEEET